MRRFTGISIVWSKTTKDTYARCENSLCPLTPKGLGKKLARMTLVLLRSRKSWRMEWRHLHPTMELTHEALRNDNPCGVAACIRTRNRKRRASGAVSHGAWIRYLLKPGGRSPEEIGALFPTLGCAVRFDCGCFSWCNIKTGWGGSEDPILNRRTLANKNANRAAAWR